MSKKPSVGIYRLQLFKPSEPFIANQVRHYSRYRPTFIGRRRFGPLPWDTAEVAIPDLSFTETMRFLAFRSATRFSRVVNADRPKLLHAHFAVDGVYALELARVLGIPLVTTLHGFDVTRADLSLLGSGRPALVNAVLHRTKLQRTGALFLCVSDFIRRAAVQRGYPPEKTFVHYIGIDTERLTPRDGPGEDGTIVHVARLVEKKGTTFLLKAMQKIRIENPAARLTIIGDGPLRQILESEAHSLGIGDAVTFTGMIPNSEVVRHIRSAAILAVPSITARSGDAEGLPTVNMEASAQSVPIVASDSGGMGEAVVDGQTGYLVAQRDAETLADRIGRLLREPERRVAMGKRARRLMEEKFDVKRQSQRLEEYYDSVAK